MVFEETFELFGSSTFLVEGHGMNGCRKCPQMMHVVAGRRCLWVGGLLF